MKYAIHISRLTKKYGKILALDNLNLSVKKGSVYGMVGINGSGKTTLFRIIAGLTSKNSGEIKIMNHGDTKIGFTIEEPALYGSKSIKENVKIHCLLANISYKENIARIIQITDLDENKKVKNLSYGMKQQLALALAILNEPEILILDEPTNGLDPVAIVKLRNLLTKLSNDGMTILIASHMLSELVHIATDYGFIHKGKIIQEISAEELMKKGDIETYFTNLIGG